MVEIKKEEKGVYLEELKNPQLFIKVLKNVSTLTLALSSKFQKTDSSNMTSHGEMRKFIGSASVMRQPTTKPSLELE